MSETLSENGKMECKTISFFLRRNPFRKPLHSEFLTFLPKYEMQRELSITPDILKESKTMKMKLFLGWHWICQYFLGVF